MTCKFLATFLQLTCNFPSVYGKMVILGVTIMLIHINFGYVYFIQSK